MSTNNFNLEDIIQFNAQEWENITQGHNPLDITIEDEADIAIQLGFMVTNLNTIKETITKYFDSVEDVSSLIDKTYDNTPLKRKILTLLQTL